MSNISKASSVTAACGSLRPPELRLANWRLRGQSPTDGHVLALSGLKAKKEIESGHYSFAVDSEAEGWWLGKVGLPARQSASSRRAELLQIKNHYCNNARFVVERDPVVAIPALDGLHLLPQLALLAYNFGNLWRRLELPHRIKTWSLTNSRQRLMKTDGQVKHAQYLLAAAG